MGVKDDVREAINDRLGGAQDNLHRAKHAARNVEAQGKNPAEYQWGQSGMTLGEIIAGYQSEVDRWQRALNEVG